MNWHVCADTSSLAWGALDLEFASKTFDALLHRMKPQVTRKRSRRIKPLAIITYFHGNHLAHLLQAQLYLARTSVLDCVMQGFLRNTIKVLFDFEGHIGLITEVHLNDDALPRMQRRRLFVERSHQPFGLQRFGA